MSKSLTIAALLASLTLGGCLGGTTGGGEFVDLSAYQRGKLHFNAGRFGLAVNHFQSAVRREPASIEALNGLAASYDRLGRYDLSARYYQRALATDPESTQTLNNIGYSYLLQERFDLAVAYLRDAQSRDRKDPVVLANRRAAEVSYQEADLKRSAEEARTKRFAAAQPPASPVQVASSRRVKPWIERTAPRIQTLVTQPQLALLGAVEEVGIDPQLAAYRPQQPTAAELLPDHAVAPMTLDARPSPEPGEEAVGREVRWSAPTPVGPRAPDQPRSVPVTGLAPAEVTIASLDPLAAFEGVAAEGSDGADGALGAGLAVGSVVPVDPGPHESLGAIALLLPQARAEARAEVPNRIEATHSAPIEAIVASLDPSRGLSDVAPGQGRPASVATTELVAPEVALSDLDPLDALEDDLLAVPQEAAEVALAEFEVAKLGTVVPDAPRVDAGPAAGGGVAVSANMPWVEVSNGTGRLAMAARLRDHLEAKGIVVKRLTNAEHYRHQETIIFYRDGWRAYAENLARMLPVVVGLDGRDGQESDVRLELGGDLLEFDRGLYYAVKRSNGAKPG